MYYMCMCVCVCERGREERERSDTEFELVGVAVDEHGRVNGGNGHFCYPH